MPINNKLKNPRVTVIIPAYNEEALIGKTLEAIKKQAFNEEFELIVVDNNSTDHTATIANNLGARVVKELIKGNTYAVDRGFKEAKGEIVVMTDADTSPPPDWLSTITSPYMDKSVVGAGTRVIFKGVPNYFNDFHKLGTNLNPVEAMWGPSLSARKSAWKKVGGFVHGFELNGDAYFTLLLKKIGTVKIIKDYYLPISGRRFRGTTLQILGNYFPLGLNSLFMMITGKGLIKTPFKDIREKDLHKELSE